MIICDKALNQILNFIIITFIKDSKSQNYIIENDEISEITFRNYSNKESDKDELEMQIVNSSEDFE